MNSEVDGKADLKSAFLLFKFRVGVFDIDGWLEFDAGDFLDFDIDLVLDFYLSF